MLLIEDADGTEIMASHGWINGIFLNDGGVKASVKSILEGGNEVGVPTVIVGKLRDLGGELIIGGEQKGRKKNYIFKKTIQRKCSYYRCVFKEYSN